MIELTTEQWQAIAAAGESPPTVRDPSSQESFVLIRKELYLRLVGNLDEEDCRQLEPYLAVLDPEDWEDASAYQDRP